MKKLIAFIVVAAVVAGAGMFLKKQKEAVASLPQPKRYIHSIDTVTPKEGNIDLTREFLAQVVSSKSAFIASKFSATIKRIHVKESDRVKKGQLLVTLDDREIKATLASLKQQQQALQSDLANMQKIHERNKKLYKIDAISKEALDNSSVALVAKRSALEGVKEKIKQSKAMLSYLQLRAPFGGVVGSKLADEGSLALPGKPILSINGKDQKLIFSFAEDVRPIIAGQKVLIDGKVIGEVAKRYDDAKNALLVAEVRPYAPLPYANRSFVRIDVLMQSVSGCIVPQEAILHKEDANYVMLYEKSRFVADKVELLAENMHAAALKECPKAPVAVASEAKLSILPSYGEVLIDEDKR